MKKQHLFTRRFTRRSLGVGRGLVVFALILFTVLLCAQTSSVIQNGLVREQNSGKKPLAGVQVIFSDGVPASSDQSGKFRLVFSGKKPGDLIFLTEIRKAGYELVNEKELQVLKISNTDQLGLDIILARGGTIDAAKKEYYAVSDKALLTGFNKRKQELQRQIQNAVITQQEYLDRFEDLQDQYDRQKKSLDALAEKFAKVNFDDVSAVYKEALELFKAGMIDEAIKKLEDADLLGRSNGHIQERIRIEAAKDTIAAQKAENEKGIQEDIQAMLRQAQIYVSKGRDPDAAAFYDHLLLLDQTNLAVLQECADFYKRNNMIEKALPLYLLIIAHPQADELQKAKATQDWEILSRK